MDRRIYRTHLGDQMVQIEMNQLTGNTIMLKLADVAVLITGTINHDTQQLITINHSFKQPVLINLLLEAFLQTMTTQKFTPVVFDINVWGNANNINLVTLISMGLSLLCWQMHLPLAQPLIALNVQAVNLRWRIGQNTANHLLIVSNYLGIVLAEGKFAALSRTEVIVGFKYAYEQLLPLIKFIAQIGKEQQILPLTGKQTNNYYHEYQFIKRQLLLTDKPHVLPVTSAMWLYGDTQVIAGVDADVHHLLIPQHINLDDWTNFIVNALAALHLPINKLATVTINDNGNLLVSNLYADLLALNDSVVSKQPIYAVNMALMAHKQVVINPTLQDEQQAQAIFSIAGYNSQLLSLRISGLVNLIDIHAILMNIDTTSKLL